jgi:hypothetical protein
MADPRSPSDLHPVVRAQTLPLQRLVNRVVRGLLRAPLMSLVVGRRLVTVYVVGRKTGRTFAVPVAFSRCDGGLLVGSQFAWIRNLRTGEPVLLRLAGRKRRADVKVFVDEDGVVERLALMARDNHQFAKFNRIGFDQAGDPLIEDLRLAWNAGARVAVLTPG